MIHELKTWPKYFNAVKDGSKTFEARKNDRDYNLGDFLVLREYDPEKEEYTGEFFNCKITYILKGEEFGVKEGFVIMSIKEF